MGSIGILRVISVGWVDCFRAVRALYAIEFPLEPSISVTSPGELNFGSIGNSGDYAFFPFWQAYRCRYTYITAKADLNIGVNSAVLTPR